MTVDEPLAEEEPPRGKGTAKAPWPGQIAAVGVLAVMVAFGIRYAIEHPAKTGIIDGLIVALGMLGLLAERHPQVGRAAATVFTIYLPVTAVLVAAALPLVGARLLADAAVGVPLGAGIPIVTAWSVLYLFCVF